jgi:uncharacterized protein
MKPVSSRIEILSCRMRDLMLPRELIKLELNVPVKMRDGITLYADIWRPESADKYPAVLIRFPYDKGVLYTTKSCGYLNFQRMAESGYAVVIQDIRGTGVSEGAFYFFRSDCEDGYDTVEWASAQSWCNGNVGMYGISAFGTTQWQAAVARPPHLKTICPSMTSAESPFCKGGVVVLGFLPYYLSLSGLALKRKKLAADKFNSLWQRYSQITDNFTEQFKFLPLKDAPANKLIEEIGMMPVYTDFLEHIEDQEYWARLCVPTPFEKIKIPVFHITSWYDHLQKEMLADYVNIKERGGSGFARKNQKLLIGPWLHGSELGNIVGEVNFGINAAGDSIDVTGMHIRWFNYWLKDIDSGILNEPPVRIFIMSENTWRDENEWPLARTQYTNYYFHSGGRANSCMGDGGLSAEAPGDEPPDTYIYDPLNPVYYEAGVIEGKEAEKRDDVLIYTTQILEKDVEVTGPLVVELYAASSAVDTDFTAKLVDVRPDGKDYRLNAVGGIVRARYRDSQFKPELIKPGLVYKYSIELGATGNLFKAGHRIRVVISSSSFPYWDRNLNTGKPVGQDTEIKSAAQIIYHNGKYPSHIILPVIPR